MAAIKQITTTGLEFGYFDEGPTDGPLALCLHGFPDTAHCRRLCFRPWPKRATTPSPPS
ncbi:hypothetical protein AB0O75_13245 [Streptomyces sp. NPDC088921]|uniref:alpha/beta fold hydrolase n=1 Tax=unclassified Streptomyces TaxID=2593676 RepID=UPI003412A33E